jgi:two-component system sensor histidine kinase VicK
VTRSVPSGTTLTAKPARPVDLPPVEPAVLLAAMLLESSDDAIIGTNRQGMITTWNRAAGRLYGYAAHDVLGKNIAFLLPKDRAEELEALLLRVADDGGAQHYETKRVHRDGAVIDVAVTVSPIRDLDDSIVGISTIQRNITERKKTDAVVAELAAIVDSSNDAIIGKTLEGVVTTWNRGAEHVYGFTAEEMVGKSVSLLVPPGHPDEIRQIIAGMVTNNARTDHFDTQRLHKDGHLIDISLTVSPIRDSDGTIVGASTVARDVTDQKAMAESLKASELRSVLAVSRAKDEMVSLVSHELRTPLASLLGFTELLYARDFSEAQRKQYLEVMLREGRRLTNLINDVLQIQRLESGHQTLNLAPAEMNALVHRAVAAAGVNKMWPIEFALSEPLPLVMVDTDAILQVLANFLANARKFTPDGGAVVITTQVVGDMVQVGIQDHGLGIPADALPKVFGTFYRIERTDRRLIKGTGLGLAINRTIVEAHGGQVGVVSDGPGQGSRFHFTVKAVQTSPRSIDVLIVEDDTGFAGLLEAQLGGRGLSAICAADAETAERLLKEGLKPRAFVVDLMLPGTQGEEFVPKLRAHSEVAVPIVVLTVKSLGPAEIASLIGGGATAVLPKEAGATEAAVSLIAEALAQKVTKR